MNNPNNQRGMSLVEFMAATVILSVVVAAGHMVFLSSSSTISTVDTQIRLANDLRQALTRVSRELQESGKDKNGVFQVAVADSAGLNQTDILKFSIPLCVCGASVTDTNNDIAAWGASFNWAQNGCFAEPEVNGNGKVTICHLPPGNPENKNTLEVAGSTVNAHLAHGDYLGDCDDCAAPDYKYIEYRVTAGGRLARRVLTSAGGLVKEDLFAGNIADFQVSVNPAQTVVTVTVTVSGKTSQNRQLTRTQALNVLLKN